MISFFLYWQTASIVVTLESCAAYAVPLECSYLLFYHLCPSIHSHIAYVRQDQCLIKLKKSGEVKGFFLNFLNSFLNI